MTSLSSTPDDVRTVVPSDRLVIPVPVVTAVAEICQRRSLFIPSSGAAVTLANGRGEAVMAYASSPGVADVEEYGFSVDEGPAVDALRQNVPVLVSPIDDDAMRRWPAYGPAAVEHGCRSAWAFPLHTRDGNTGTLTLYAPSTINLTDYQLAFALRLAQTVASSLTITTP
jgi:GAF domain-containing protein